MFGCSARVGQASAGIPHLMNHLATEEDIENLLKEMEGKSNDLEDPNSHGEREDEENTVPETVDAVRTESSKFI
jgi:hypothetical protein